MDDERSAVVRRWLELTRVVLPGMAVGAGWPIRLDHCFMRVFLDDAMGGRWDAMVARPAVRHMPLEALRRAVAAAERVVEKPEVLAGMNAVSLGYRGVSRLPRSGRVATPTSREG